MNLLEKHRQDYKTLKKKELYKIIEEQLEINRKRIDRNVYNYLYSKRNNSRRALRGFWNKRHWEKSKRDKVKHHLAILKQIRDEGRI